MKTKSLLKKVGFGFVWPLLCAVLFAGCLRFRVGEDLFIPNSHEISRLKQSIIYIKDERTNLCFACINNATDGFRNTFVISNVPCENVYEFIK